MTRARIAAILLPLASGCSNAPAPAASPSATPNPLAWTATATGLGVPGDRFSFDCPPSGAPATVWGDTTYTADSSVCTAAVHAGRLQMKNGGRVTIEIAAGLSAYTSSTKHGVTTRSYGSWAQSFVFPKEGWLAGIIGTPPVSATPTPTAVPVFTWGTPWGSPIPTATPHRIGDRAVVDCDGSDWGSVWGSDVYTADSAPCRAAVHAGVLAPNVPGRVTIEYVAGEGSYVSTTRNGVTSSPWQSYPMSFVFPGAASTGPRTLARAFADAKLDAVLDRTFTGVSTDTWEMTLYRDGTVTMSKTSAKRRFNVIGKAAPLTSDAESVRIAINGTIHRYDSGKPLASPVTAQLVLRPSIRGVEIAEESSSLGLGSAGIDFHADDE